jgi:hypothetical protein
LPHPTTFAGGGSIFFVTKFYGIKIEGIRKHGNHGDYDYIVYGSKVLQINS